MGVNTFTKSYHVASSYVSKLNHNGVRISFRSYSSVVSAVLFLTFCVCRQLLYSVFLG